MLFKEITVEEFAEIRAREAAKDAYDEGENPDSSKAKSPELNSVRRRKSARLQRT